MKISGALWLDIRVAIIYRLGKTIAQNLGQSFDLRCRSNWKTNLGEQEPGRVVAARLLIKRRIA